MNPPAANHLSRRLWMSLAVIAAGGSAFGIRRFAGEAIRQRQADRETTRLLELEIHARLTAVANSALGAAGEADRELMATLRSRLVSDLAALQTGAAAYIPDIAIHLGSFNEVGRSILLMARDRVTGTRTMEEYLEQKLAPMADSLARMNVRAEVALNEFGHGLNAHSNQLTTRVLTAINEVREHNGAEFPSLDSSLQRIHGSITGGQIALGTAAISAPLEIGALVKVVDLVWKFLAARLEPYVARAASTAGANLALAAVDGPLPVGEILALLVDLGFAAWTIWDLVNLRKTVPREIGEELARVIHAHRLGTLDAAGGAMSRSIQLAQQARLQALQPLLALAE